MKITNKHNLPDVVVSALTKETYSRGKSDISVTTLIDAPRVGLLKKLHDDKIEMDAVDFLWSRFGTAMHNVFEDAADHKGIISEERLFLDYQGWCVSGAIDLQTIDSDGVIISDYKVTSVWSVINDKVEWHNQLNAYAWLVRHAKGMRVKSLRIIAILRDWQRRKATELNYPSAPMMIVNIPLWSESEQDDYMQGRINLHQAADFEYATGGTLPECSGKERWTKADSFAVKKKGRVRALKVHDSMDSAEKYLEELGDDHYIEERKGEPTRCAGNWCRVADWCGQYQDELDLNE
jgi:hypothetical protein